jgi:hypothetical protein
MKAILLIPALLCTLTIASAQESYFPIITKSAHEGLTASRADWHGKSLERMNEPRLPAIAEDGDVEIYRLMILPTWGNPVVVRAERHGELYSLHARRLDGQGGYDPRKLIE